MESEKETFEYLTNKLCIIAESILDYMKLPDKGEFNIKFTTRKGTYLIVMSKIRETPD